MNKLWLALSVLIAGVFLLVCSGGSSAVGPLADNYDHAKLFEVKLVSVLPNGFAQVEIHWLIDKMDRGDSPFSFGPQDASWSSSDLISLSKTITVGKHDYYYYQTVVQTGKTYNVGGGLSWSGSNMDGYRWLTPSEQGGCPYYNPKVKIMSFTAYDDGYIQAGN